MENITKQRDADKESGEEGKEEKRIWFKRRRSLCVCVCTTEKQQRGRRIDPFVCYSPPVYGSCSTTATKLMLLQHYYVDCGWGKGE